MKKDFAGRVAEAGLKFKEFITEMYTTNLSAKDQFTYAQSKFNTDELIIQKYTNFRRKPEKATTQTPTHIGLKLN